MKKYFKNLNVNHLTAVFLASMFGSLSLTALLNSAIEPGAALPIDARIALTLMAVVTYAAIVWLTFYLIVPEYRPALRRIIGGRE